MSALPGLLLIAFIFVLVIAQYLKILRMAQRLPPGPTPFPVIGTLWQMRFAFSYETLITLAKSHGNVFTLWLGQLPIIILNGFEAVKEGLTAHPEDMNGRPTSPFFEKLGKGKGQPMEPSFPIVLAVSNVICALLFGYRFSKEDEIFHRLIKRRHQKAFACYDFSISFVMKEIRSHEKSGTLDNPQNFIDFYLAQMAKTPSTLSIPSPKSLDMHSQNKDDPTSTLDENNLAYSIFDFFIAGSETTATTLHWALLYMVAYPDTQAKVQKELDDTLGSSSRLICCSDWRNLPYTNAVIHEIQRYANIILIGGPRQSVKDTTVLGFPIQKRACLGENLARMELFLLFANLLRRFHFQLPEGVTEVNTKYIKGMTLQPRPQLLRALPR
ncbi:hypothetical protein Chor_014539 [Crotalus horridus]